MKLKRIRQTVAILSILAVTSLFLDFTGVAHVWFGWMAKIQSLPALLALNVGVIIALIVATLLFGRIYGPSRNYGAFVKTGRMKC